MGLIFDQLNLHFYSGNEFKFQPKSSDIKASTLETAITLMDSFCLLILANLEIKMVSKPSFDASCMRCSVLGTGLISPDNPTSAAKQKFSQTLPQIALNLKCLFHQMEASY